MIGLKALMFKISFCLSFSILFMLTSCAQDKVVDYAGMWKGEVKEKNPFNIDISIAKEGTGSASFIMSNENEILRKPIKLRDTIIVQLNKELVFKAIMKNEHSEINGYVKLGNDFYPVVLHQKNDIYHGKWNLAANYFLQPESLFLNVVKLNEPDNGFRAYPKLGAYWVSDCKIENDVISFQDYKTGLLFEGELEPSKIEMTIRLGKIVMSKISYYKFDESKNLLNRKRATDKRINDGWEYSEDQLILDELEKDISTEILEGVESVLIAQHGQLRYENYFGNANAETPNDLRSAGKSIGSAMIGIAIDEGIIENVQENVYPYLPKEFQYTKDAQKSKIRIHDLLTMSSGIGVYENDYQESDDWLKMVLEPELNNDPGTHTNYMSADPFLLSVYLSNRLSYPLEFYMQEKFYTPLGITNYIQNTDDTGIPYFAGGLNLIPRDMLKFGQLYLNKGKWNGKRILSEKWVEESFKKHTRLENASDKNEYGYFWWHDVYTINGKALEAIEARGNGGQYICVIPELNAVVVVSTENYNNRRLSKQTGKIIRDYVLPNLSK